MSKGVKKVVGIVAAIAIPFAAPVIAGAIGLSGAVSGIAATIGLKGAIGAGIAGAVSSGITGAVLGGATAALTGGDWKKGALMGGLGSAIGGGLKGFSAAKTMQAGGTAASAITAPGSTATGVTGATRSAISNMTAAAVPGAATGAATTIAGKIGNIISGISPDLALRVASYMISGQLSGDPDEDRQIAAIAKQAAENDAELKALYNRALADADRIDPEGDQLRAYNQAKLEGLAATEAATENLSQRGQTGIAEVTRRGMQDAVRLATIAGQAAHTAATNRRTSALGALSNMRRPDGAQIAFDAANIGRENRARRTDGTRAAIMDIGTRVLGLPDDADEDFDPRVRTGLPT